MIYGLVATTIYFGWKLRKNNIKLFPTLGGLDDCCGDLGHSGRTAMHASGRGFHTGHHCWIGRGNRCTSLRRWHTHE
jgi:hypothetical protein